MPLYLTENKGFEPLGNMVKRLYNRFRYALEVREFSWLNNEGYDFLKESKILLVWSVRDELKTPPIVTSDQIYIRFIGDRSIDERDFGKIVKNRDIEMIEYIDKINKMQHYNEEQQTIAVAYNNHFTGIGPQSANYFLKLMDRPAINNWTKEIEKSNSFYKTQMMTIKQVFMIIIILKYKILSSYNNIKHHH